MAKKETKVDLKKLLELLEQEEEGGKGLDKGQIIQSAVNEGVYAIAADHPRFKNYEQYLATHLNKKKLNEAFDELYSSAQENNLPDDKMLIYIHQNLANYVASGGAFDNLGKEVILKKSLEERAKSGGFFGRIRAKRQLQGEKYLDNTFEAFNELYGLIQQGQYAEKMPEIAKPLQEIYDIGFLNPALDILKEYNLIDSGKYRDLKESVLKRAKKGREEVVKGIEKYAFFEKEKSYQKAAAIVALVFGIVSMIFSRISSTGYAVSEDAVQLTGLLGIGSFIAGIILLLIISKKKNAKFKKSQRKNLKRK